MQENQMSLNDHTGCMSCGNKPVLINTEEFCRLLKIIIMMKKNDLEACSIADRNKPLENKNIPSVRIPL